MKSNQHHTFLNGRDRSSSGASASTELQSQLIHNPPVLKSITMVNIPYRWFMYPQYGSFLFGMFGSLCWALWFSYEQVIRTHCHVKQFFPSFSSVIGNGFPELFFWRMGMLVLLPLRFVHGILLHWSHTRKQLYYQPGGSSRMGLSSSGNPDGRSYQLTTLEESSSKISTSLDARPPSSPSSLQINSTTGSKSPKYGKRNRLSILSTTSQELPPNPRDSFGANPNQQHISIGHQHVSTSRYILSLFNTFMLWAEYSGLALLSFVSSTESFLPHAGGFILFIVSSQIHTFTNLMLTLHHFKTRGLIFKIQIVKMVLWVMNWLAIYLCYYFYTTHNTSCPEYYYSYFGLSEYTLVITNATSHFLTGLQDCWMGQFSCSLINPSLALHGHPDNYNILKHNSAEDWEWLQHGQIDVPILNHGTLTDDELDGFLETGTSEGQGDIDNDSLRNYNQEHRFAGYHTGPKTLPNESFAKKNKSLQSTSPKINIVADIEMADQSDLSSDLDLDSFDHIEV